MELTQTEEAVLAAILEDVNTSAVLSKLQHEGVNITEAEVEDCLESLLHKAGVQ